MSYKKQLLVEGNDDLHVVSALCQKFDIVEDFQIIDCKGIDNLLNQIPDRIKQKGIEIIGILVDADADISVRWQTLSSKLNALGYTVPPILPDNGLVIQQAEKATIGVWIMPNNNLNGMIEDFVAFLVPVGDGLLTIANKTLDLIEKDELNKYKLVHRSKALIHTWLAWQEDPGTPMGSSITKRYLTADAEICNTFIDWLKAVFN